MQGKFTILVILAVTSTFSNFLLSFINTSIDMLIINEPLQLTVKWYKIRLTGEQATHWGIQIKLKKSQT